MTHRRLDEIHQAIRDDVGSLHTHQVIPASLRDRLTPFLLLAHHGPQVYAPNNRGLPFGPHPHRGFETVTFIRSGSLAHHDTGGHESIIDAGGVQWMTAGSGLIHAEVSPPAFRRDGGPIEILQLWVNLPAHLKMTAPRYVGIAADAVTGVELGDDAVLSLVSGQFGSHSGPITSLTDLFMSTVEVRPERTIVLPAPQGRTVLFYVIAGAVLLDGTKVAAGKLAMFNNTGDAIKVTSGAQGASLLFANAEPIDEPIVASGPFIMNSETEIAAAIQDYKAGRFDGIPISLEA